MERVACTHPMNPQGVAQGGGVLCSRVAQTGSHFGGFEQGLLYVSSGPDPDLHMLCGKETPARPNRFESPLLLEEGDSIL